MKIRWLILFLCPAFISSQVSFLQESAPWGAEKTYSGVPVGIYDLNGDHLDDMIILDGTKHLKVFHQTLNSERFKASNFGKVSFQDQISLAVGDLDNDGVAEILVGGYYDGVKVYKQYEDSDAYLLYTTTAADFYTQNISLVDVDGDGFLDVYVNDDDGRPKLYKNLDGMTLELWDIIPWEAEGEAASGNYGSVWTDFDMDGDVDLYISKCRLGVDDAEDPRRINQLYVNEGGEFFEQAANYGLASGEQTWVADFVDLDNDLDLDVVLVNHTGGNEIYENKGEGQYLRRNIGNGWSKVFEGLQLVVRDLDQDGLKDIAIAGLESKLFWNKGNFVFQEDEGGLSVRNTLSMAVGDLNHDGREDLLVGYGENMVERSAYFQDLVLMNQGANERHVTVSLVGSESNRDAVGSKVYAYSGLDQQVMEVKNGSSYGIACTKDVVFGFSEEDGIDSLVIVWPSGESVQYLNIDLNKHYIIHENACVSNFIEAEFPDSKFLCTGMEYEIGLSGYASYEWSSGSVDSFLSVAETGYYRATVTDGAGCEDVMGLLSVESFQLPELELVDRKKIYCAGEGLVVEVQYDSVRWSSAVQGAVNYDVASDDIYAEFQVCGEWLRSENLDINLLRVDTPAYVATTINKGETGIWEVEGEQVLWYTQEEGGIAFHDGKEWAVDQLQQDSTLYVENVVKASSIDYGGIAYDPLQSGYPSDNANGGLVLSVGDFQTNLVSVKCITDKEAVRRFILTDYWGNVINERMVFVGPSDSIVQLGFMLNPLEVYILTTDGEVNMANLGTRAPRLERSIQSGSYFPLASESGNVVIEESTGSSGVYYSFYDMVFQDYEVSCTSQRIGITIFVDEDSGVGEQPAGDLLIRPNPAMDDLNIRNADDEPYSLYSSQGGKVGEGIVRSERVDVRGLKAGLYFIKIGDQLRRFIKL